MIRKFDISFILRAILPAKFLWATLFVLLLASCKKESAIGLDVQPEEGKVNVVYSDTMALDLCTIIEDSLRSDELPISLLGCYNDPLFGISEAYINTQFSLPNNINNVNFGTLSELVADSLVLSFVYDPNYYGTLEAQTFNVYELQEQLYSDSNYYSNKTAATSSNSIGSITVTPSPNDSVAVGTSKQKAQLRIRLDDALALKLLNESGSANLSSSSAFQAFFKGVQVRSQSTSPTSGTGAILYFNLNDGLSGMTLYYHNAVTSANQTFQFITASGSARYTQFKHNYGGSAAGAAINDSIAGKNLIYIQSMAGTKIKLNIPGLSDLNKQGSISINKAELIIKADAGSAGNYAIPNKLLLVGADSTGKPFILKDQLEGESYFGGTYNSTTKEYRFNIARHIQQILNGNYSHSSFQILSSGGSVAAYRLVAGGSKHPTLPMKLKLTYTKL